MWTLEPKALHNASAHNCGWALYNWKSFVYVSWGIIIQALHMDDLTKIYMQWSRTFTFYWILDSHFDFATDVDSNIVDLINRVCLPGMCSSVLTAARTRCLRTEEKDFDSNSHFVKTAVYFKSASDMKAWYSIIKFSHCQIFLLHLFTMHPMHN